MLNVGVTNSPVPAPQQHATLWRCGQCDSLVSIHSMFILDEASCPACGTAQLELCGTFDGILGLRFADA
jgi:uncharacterized paraquat-inducible protein A